MHVKIVAETAAWEAIIHEKNRQIAELVSRLPADQQRIDPHDLESNDNGSEPIDPEMRYNFATLQFEPIEPIPGDG